MTARWRTFAILLGVVATACTRCSRPETFEFYVEGVPHTVDDAKDMDDPPDVEVTVEKGGKVGTGGAACGHSPVCIVLVPVLIGDALFPEHYRVVTVKKSGAVWYSGLYRANGEFMHGVITENGQARRIDLVEASYIRRKVVVETAHGPLGPDGKPAKMEPTSVQKQVDLLTGYKEVLERPGAPDKHGRELAEALRILDHDAVELAKTELGKNTEFAFRAPVLRTVCSASHPVPDAAADRGAIVDAVAASKPDAAIALEALGCFDDLKNPRVTRLLKIVTSELCTEPKESTVRGFRRFAGVGDNDSTLPEPGEDARADQFRKVVKPLLDACDNRGIQALLRRFVATADDDTLKVALLESPPWAQVMAGDTLDPNEAHDHDLLIWALGQEGANHTAVVKRLSSADPPPDDAEAGALVSRYLASADNTPLRIYALQRLSKIEDAKTLLTTVSRALAVEKDGDEQIALRALLVALHDEKQQAKLVVESVDRVCRSPAVMASASAAPSASLAPPASAAPSVSAAPSASAPAEPACTLIAGNSPADLAEGVGELAFYALRLNGCSYADLHEAYSAVRAGDKLSNPVCKPPSR